MSREMSVPMTAKEWLQVKRVAQQHNITVEEAAAQLISAGLTRRVRRRTGKAPAKVYEALRKGG